MKNWQPLVLGPEFCFVGEKLERYEGQGRGVRFGIGVGVGEEMILGERGGGGGAVLRWEERGNLEGKERKGKERR